MRVPGALIVGLTFAWGGGALPQNATPLQAQAISVGLRTERSTFNPGDPMIVKQTITNRSDHPVTIANEVYHPGCPVDVIDENGNFARDRRPGYRRGRLDIQELARTLSPEQLAASGALNGKFAWITLKPGEEWSATCDLSSFFDLTKPGTYRLSTRYNDPDSGAPVRSNAVQLTVKKPD